MTIELIQIQKGEYTDQFEIKHPCYWIVDTASIIQTNEYRPRKEQGQDVRDFIWIDGTKRFKFMAASDFGCSGVWIQLDTPRDTNWQVKKPYYSAYPILSNPILHPYETPLCKCGGNNWVIGRKFLEQQTWSPCDRQLLDKEEECTDLWVFCGDCGSNANMDNDKELIEFLEKQL